MEAKRGDSGAHPPANGGDISATEPTSSRRRGGSHKRKISNILGGSASSSAPSKRFTREKALLNSAPPIDNGPLTRARHVPSIHSEAAAKADNAQAKRPEVTSLEAEQAKRESELEGLEAAMEAEFEAVRSRDPKAHVVPRHCGWFSWTKVHAIEERMLSSFFDGKSDTRTPDSYLEIRNCIMRKFHADPGTLVELKDMLELEVGDLESRQEVMEFLDHWGLINFHPFLSTGSPIASVKSEELAERASLVDKLYRFEALESRSSLVPKAILTSPTVSSGLFPESAIAEEVVKPEGPAVEYHCNSCSADCSRKRYHCQKQADFDLCTDCFNNGKFDSGMSSTDFILMEPAEAHGVSSGNWTDQETLLLLEALELFIEDWNEIADHVATKTKAQCILHFVQMPIEDTFLDHDDDDDGDVTASAKETLDPTSSNNEILPPKDVPETSENKTSTNGSDPQTSPMENSKEASEPKDGEDTSNPKDGNEVKAFQDALNLEATVDLKLEQETYENLALKALKEAFEDVGYPQTLESQLSFADVGNPVMALAAFLARLVGPDHAISSAHNSLKSVTGNAPGIELVLRHCFILEDPPTDGKEQASCESATAEKEAQSDKVDQEDNHKEDNSSTFGLEGGGLSNGNEKELEETAEEKSQSTKEEDHWISHEKLGTDKLTKSNYSELPKDQQPTLGESDDSKLDAPPSSRKELGEGTSIGKPSETTDTPMDVDASISTPLSKAEQPSQSTETTKEKDVSHNLASERDEPSPSVTVKSEEASQPNETSKDVDMGCDTVASHDDEPSQPVEKTTDEDQTDSKHEKHDSIKQRTDKKQELKCEQKIDKVKQAAVSALSAAAVKAKLLAEQEEDQIRQLAAMLIEKQLHKLEAKLGLFNEMESVVMRVKEQLDRSRQKLYHERAQIIAARLGLPGSSSRGMPSGMPTNRMATNATNAVPRPPLMMTPQRPLMSRPMGAVPPTPLNHFTPTSSTATPVRPPIQDSLLLWERSKGNM